MKILVVADQEARQFYDFYTPGKLAEFDLIISCGDLHARYLEFLVTMAGVPLLYVHGNHDDSYEKVSPEGCECIEDRIYVYKGLRVMGLGGSMRYRDNAEFMCTEKEMRSRIRKMRRKLKKHKGVDIIVTHAPPYQLGDLEDLPHRGFQCFRELIDNYSPRYFLHGHIHRNYGVNIPVKREYGQTTIINACGYYVLEIPDESLPVQDTDRKGKKLIRRKTA